MLFKDYEQEHSIHSPVRTQYLNIKGQNPDAILFFRMGDFYEMFDDDAEIVARELEIALTRRDFGRGEKSPMAGIPAMVERTSPTSIAVTWTITPAARLRANRSI